MSKQSLLALVFMLWAGSANATFFYYFGADDPVDGNTNTVSGSGINVDAALAEAAWEAQVRQLYGQNSIVDFKTTATNVRAASTSNAVKTAIDNQLNNINLSNPTAPTGAGSDHSNATSGLATFNAVGSAPSFTIQQKEVIGGNYSGVFFDDAPTGKSQQTIDGWRNTISIGKFNGFLSGSGLDTTDYDDDDFTIEITGGDTLYAFAFRMINSKKNNTDSFDVTTQNAGTFTFADSGGNPGVNGMEGIWVDANGNIVPPNTPGATEITGATDDIPGYTSGEGCTVLNNCPGASEDYRFLQESFVGIVTDDLNEIFSLFDFNEGSGVNDIGILDFRFAVVPVPLPAGIWLLFSGLIALFGLDRKRNN